MLSNPKFLKPSATKEERVIDVTSDDKILFSCVVDGNEGIEGYQIYIRDIEKDDEDDNMVFTCTATLDPPFYPIDEKNRNVAFEIDIKNFLSDFPEFINRKEAYYWDIRLFGTSGNSTVSCPEVFYANTTPTLILYYKHNESGDVKLENGCVLRSKEYTFKATYRQPEGVGLKKYGWRIIDKDNNQTLIDTISKNCIYGSADNIVCTYDGFLKDGNYSIEVFVETQNGAKVISSPISFSIEYESTFLDSNFRVEPLTNEPAIMLNWDKSIVITGDFKDANDGIVNIEDIPFKTDFPVKSQSSIEIPSQYKLVYGFDPNSSMDIDENSYIAISTQLLDDVNTTLFYAEGFDYDGNAVSRKLSYSNSNKKLVYDVMGYDAMEEEVITKSTSHDVENKPSQYVWYIIFMSPLIKDEQGNYNIDLDVVESRIVDCIYPSQDLYPEEKGFYPVLGVWNNLKGE